MSSRFHRGETQRTRLVLNRETVRTLQRDLRLAPAQAPTGQDCGKTKAPDAFVC